MPKPNFCDLSFVCQKKWEELTSTDDAAVRFCDHCTKGVFAIQTREELSVASAVGRCVALKKDNKVFGWIGEPEGEWDWMEGESKIVKIRSNNTIPSNTLNRIRLAFPQTFDQGVVWSPAEWITIGKFTPYVARNLTNEFLGLFPEFEIEAEDV